MRGEIAAITLNRPAVLNGIDVEFAAAFGAALDRMDAHGSMAHFHPVARRITELGLPTVAADALVAGLTLAYATIKRLVASARNNELAAQFDAERFGCTQIASTTDFAEGLAAFKARRPPGFTGR